MNGYNIVLRSVLRILLVIIVFILISCYPGEPLSPEDSDIIATFYNPEADFSTKMTYAVPDSIIRLDKDGNPISKPGQFDQQIVSRIKQNLEQLGYTEEQNPANADILVVASITTTTWTSGGCYSWWYDWWYPYPGWCYPVSYTFKTGTLLMTMADRQNQGSSDALWVAGINGILEDTNIGITTRLNNNIDQAFNQSLYLGTGK